jgi:hypothetical protein
VILAVFGYLNILDFRRSEEYGERRAAHERDIKALKREIDRLHDKYGPPEIRPRLIEPTIP